MIYEINNKHVPDAEKVAQEIVEVLNNLSYVSASCTVESPARIKVYIDLHKELNQQETLDLGALIGAKEIQAINKQVQCLR